MAASNETTSPEGVPEKTQAQAQGPEQESFAFAGPITAIESTRGFLEEGPSTRKQSNVYKSEDKKTAVDKPFGGGTSSRTSSSRIDDEPWIKASRFNAEELKRKSEVKAELMRDKEADEWVVV